MQRFDDPLLRELVKDMCLDRSLRHDVFVRGARRMNPAMRDAALMDVWLALNIRPDGHAVRGRHAGRAVPSLNRAFYGPIAAGAGGRTAAGRRSARPADLDGRRDNPAELIGILVGLESGRTRVAAAVPRQRRRRCVSTA